MSRFVALLRGVNVGKGHKVPMAEFRAALEGLGHTEVRTLLNSGNAVFTSSSHGASTLAEGVGRAIEERCGVIAPVIVKSAAELEAVVRCNPFPPREAEHSRFVVAFASDPSKLEELQGLSALLKPGERFAVTSQAGYLHCAGGLLESNAGKAILGRKESGITTRNWATVLKLLALVRAGAAEPSAQLKR